MTLIELLIGMTVLLVILSALMGSLLLGLQVTAAAGQRTTDLADAQLASTYFPTDVQSADLVRTSGFICGSGTRLLELVDAAPDPADSSARHYAHAVTSDSGELALERQEYDVISGSCSLEEEVTLVHDLSGTTPPVVSCPPSASCTSTPRAVRLVLTARASDVFVDQLYTEYSFTVDGTRRES